MNEIAQTTHSDLVEYQASRLRSLIGEMLKCCEERRTEEQRVFGLPHSELKCLLLFEGERYLTVKGIAERLQVAKSRVTKIVDGLVHKGLVERVEDPEDGRIKLIRLSPAGRRTMEEVEKFQSEIHRYILLQMDPQERKAVLKELETLRSAMEAVKKRYA